MKLWNQTIFISIAENFSAVNDVEFHVFPCFKHLFKHLPKQRRLTEEETENVNHLLNLQVNKKKLQQEISKSGKIVTLRDLSNIAAKNRKKTENSFTCIIDTLKDKYGNKIFF